MAFSAALTLADLSDYLAPSQICIKPINMVEDLSPDPVAPAVERDSSLATTEIMIDSEHGYYEIAKNGTAGKKLKKAEITLNDCLACSGCITSAESVLVSMQSHEEVYRVLEEQPELVPILSIAPQSLASLAALHDLSLEETMRGLRVFFKRTFGFRLVFDTTFARSLSLAENRLEFLERRTHASTIPLAPSSTIGPLPILSSACPGWICYAEKTHGELLSFVSNVKSSQSIMGTLIKRGEVTSRLSLRPEQIYHVTVMPCYDKKLEASRPDFSTAVTPLGSETAIDVRDVDCVLTTGEVQRMLDDKGLDLAALAFATTDQGDMSEEVDVKGVEEDTFYPSFINAPGTSSGGYLHNTIHAVLQTLGTEDLYRTKLIEKRVRSEDFVEFTLVTSNIASTSSLASLPLVSPSATSTTHLRAAKCYGFRNLQNVVRKIGRDAGVSVSRGAAGIMPSSSSSAAAAKARRNAAALNRKKLGEVEDKYDYVEVMACPSGCVNGGGQIAPPKTATGRRNARGLRVEGRVDAEGMPAMDEQMETGEIKLVADLSGEERVLSGKEWVARVEGVYWGSEGRVILPPLRHDLDWSRVDSSLVPYLADETTPLIELLMQRTIDGLLGSAEGPKREELRRELLRTGYRAVEEIEVNGLAVKW